MEDYIVSARKYRPTTFQSVVGQKSLTTTLKNAIRNNKLAHAYLFCGPRGVGKTTCARIFAKTINCFNPTPEGDACNACESCVAFNEQRSYNIHELDAASNNSVDDIRSLIEQVRIPPQIGKYKVYIIDEVHMLSQSAFNAFLKTLEEPPHHAIFVLATTEKHKILPTILSRCQIYDFSRISINDMVDHLEYVARQEGVTAEKEALNVIAQKADGGMRDALSIFDQVVSFTGGNITYKAVIENLNVLDYEYYFKILDAILQDKVGNSMLILSEILEKGFDGQHIISGLASFFRDLLVAKDPQTIVLFEVGDAVKDKYLNFAARCDNKFLYKAIELSNTCDLNYRASRNKRLLSELLLIQLCQLNSPEENDEEDKKKTVIKSIAADTTVFEQPKTTVPTQQTPISSSAVTQNPQPAVKAVPKNVMSVSLKNPAGHQEEKKPDVAKQTQLDIVTPFSPLDLHEAWRRYAETLSEKIHLKNTMLNNLPALKENYRIEVLVYNPQQEQALKDEIISLAEFLRKELKNTSIIIDVSITEENTKKLAYTDKEKFELLVSKNESLSSLVKEFKLRLD
ncbi:MAG: DNA polymerase III subunit gamma/tau [Dysgonamonadaceae bacterium]|jgi:DNA polymerase-3 subunit gamma/tau|nr:DNA polymerase III subunit gamma/tau [Dysgonamonadaceae bacterium]